MPNIKLKKIISVVLSLSFMINILSLTTAANLVLRNEINFALPPLQTVLKPKNSNNGFSIKSIESQISAVSFRKKTAKQVKFLQIKKMNKILHDLRC